MQDELTLEDLVNMSGLPIRTVRYYIQEGLLPGPDTRGKFAAYSRLHLEKLRLIQYFKNLHFPLLKIRDLLNSISGEEMEEILRGTGGLSGLNPIVVAEAVEKFDDHTAGISAIDYIRNVENLNREARNRMESRIAPAAAAPSLRLQREKTVFNEQEPGLSEDGKTWRRIEVEDGVELHIRSDRESGRQEVIGRIVRIIREHLK